MSNAAERCPAVRFCRVDLSFGTGDSNLCVCGLPYISVNLSFFLSEKSLCAVFSCGAMKPFIPPARAARCCNRPVALSVCLSDRQG